MSEQLNTPKDNTEIINTLIDKIDEEYRGIVEDAEAKDMDLEIPNSTLAHAIFLSKKIIKKTEKELHILTGELTELFYNYIQDDIKEVAEKFRKNRAGHIQIIIWDRDASRNLKFEEFLEEYSDVATMKKASKDTTNRISHFLVSDAKRYRLEDFHTKDDLENYKVHGTANFCDPDKSGVLNDFFVDTWNTI